MPLHQVHEDILPGAKDDGALLVAFGGLQDRDQAIIQERRNASVALHEVII